MKKVFCLILVIVFGFGCIPVLSDGYTYSSWSDKYCEKAIEFGWTDSMPENFTKEITREQFCSVAGKVLDSCGLAVDFESMYMPFLDTENTSVAYLYNLGIIKGKSETEFVPDDLITREEAAVILSRMCDELSEGGMLQLPEIMIDMAYSDDEEIAAWAKAAVYKMATHNIMQGTDKGFEPKDNFTIEQSLITFVRLYNLVKGEKSLSFADRMNSGMPKDKNYMFSPLSVKMALALAANGANEETLSEMMHVLNIKDMDDFNQFAKELITSYSEDEDIKLNIANSIWVNKSETVDSFKKEFTDIAENYYTADSGSVTKSNATGIINSWVKEKTNNKIDSIINESNTDFWAMIINAIYFNASWQKEFNEGATKADTFINADGSKHEIDFMNRTDWYQYAESNNSRIIELPYGKRSNLDISMYVVLSDKDVYLQDEINNAKFSREYVKLSMPEFNIEFSTALNDLLKELGMNKAFSDDYNFNGILEHDSLKIDDVLHKTYIKVDEKGTEAAAVTAIGMKGTGFVQNPEPIEFKADKPFCFVIRDNTSGEILFMGRFAYAE